MKFVLTTHNVSTSEAIEDHILARIDKLEHLDRRAIETRVIIEHDKTRAPEKQFKCSVRLAVRGPDLFAEDVEGDLYAAIDVVFKKIEQQVRKLHNKRKAVRQTTASRLKRKLQEEPL
ncbi:MAG: ribosome-associated translation inhibitor RaiA [Verrucomicrobiales bacterium]|nr:ribosome-associated translation inhibitor RaiA [Verrucomicrobiales bacterium]MCP5526169.1 ribosome-associated translation inhibitor RaiA [Verrucomicrobiales bacterium]